MRIWRSTRQGTIRPIWRLIIPQFVFWTCFVVLDRSVSAIPGLRNAMHGSEIVRALVINATYLPIFALALAVFGLSARWLDKRPYRDWGFAFGPNWIVQFSCGLMLGATLMAVIFLTQWAFGWIKVSKVDAGIYGQLSVVLGMVCVAVKALLVAGWEETVFRAGLVPGLAKVVANRETPGRLAVYGAIILPACLFGAAHLMNPGASAVSASAISVAGIYIGLIYVHTGSLALPIGAHASWNFFQSHVFGFPVARQSRPDPSILTVEQLGPDLWTGGMAGPEAGLLCMFVILAATAAVLGLVRSSPLPALRSPHHEPVQP